MASYCTIANIRTELTGLTVSVMSDSAVTARINKAESIINSKLSLKYSVPFFTIPPIIFTIVIDIACYFIMRTLYSQESQNVSEWAKQFKTDLKLLDELAEGKTGLIDSAGTSIDPVEDNIKSNTEDYTPTFDEDDLFNSVIDEDKIEDIQNLKL